MTLALRELLEKEDESLLFMVQEIGSGENGFVNGLNSSSMEEFSSKVRRNYEMARSINLPDEYVPQTIYWLYHTGKPVGYGKLRHRLNEKLLESGGHIGYVIRPSERGKGYGKQMLAGLVKKACEKNISRVLLTCDETNRASRRIIEWNHGVLSSIADGNCKYWIDTAARLE
ncbi:MULTISPECIES: GNAT family N-acetyltransferase [unclassified Paenibacillus]|uniref:GNAT family N-acetyltransferase n=1 Tax=unclassified Paenibacillus TaxID=185978 RepID=UPI001788A015|nr:MULTISPECIES: GNAT family N-acetyltransferase [unclassified Paenibacillus]QOT11556.1 GNAT family N-acetyltransferase [Paenibacillus sp. JNUCC-32]WFB56363.1 GNAT family N-acetyltransferase [Paenibacillus sp. BR1-192]